MVNNSGCVKVLTNFDWAPVPVGVEVEVKVYAAYVEIWHEGKRVARHERCFGRQEKVLNLEHYLSIRQIHSALREIQTFTAGRLAWITAKLTVRPEEVSYFDRKEKKKKTSSIWALSLEVEGDDMRKLIANLTENARLFAETRKLFGSGGKVLEVVEDEQEEAREVAAESYPPSLNGSSATEPAEAASATETTPGSAPSNSPSETLPLGTVPGFLAGTGLPNHTPAGPPLCLRPTMATGRLQVLDSTNFATSF